MIRRIVFTVIFFLIGLSYAQDDAGFIQEDAHLHGAALLNIALEGDLLVMEFISPSFNIIGFEYQPSSDEEKGMVEQALVSLENAHSLFIINNTAQCELSSAGVESGIEEEHDHDEHSEEHEGEAEHDEHDHEEAETHSEFHATYEYSCNRPNRLESVDLSQLFALYPNLEDLDVQYVLPSGQGLQELNTTSTQLRF